MLPIILACVILGAEPRLSPSAQGLADAPAPVSPARTVAKASRIRCSWQWPNSAVLGNGPWIKAPAPRRQAGPGYLGDIVSRVGSPQTYMDADPVTSAHECTHGINSDMRQRYGHGWNCFYLLNGDAAIVREPPTTLANVAAHVPADQRGRGFSLYLQQQVRDWNDTPTYVLDELSAYINGACVGKQLGRIDRYRESLGSAIEFCWYAEALYRSVPAGYDAGPLRQVIDFQEERCRQLYEYLTVTLGQRL